MRHITVLEQEAVEALNLKADSVVVDATGGAGGHSAAILEHLTNNGTLIVIDQDDAALEKLWARFSSDQRVRVTRGNFRNLTEILEGEQIGKVDAILADLGWSSDQFEAGGRGFSFRYDEPLLMTLGHPDDYAFTAKSIVNEWEEGTIADMLYAYADERFSRRIASAIVERRKESPIETSGELASIVEGAIPGGRRGKTHPATRTFQALRIAVNDEFAVLKEFIPQAIGRLHTGGRLAIISFHSSEDRIVKTLFKAAAAKEEVELVEKKPIVPTRAELVSNSRARSAKLRVIQRL